MAWRGASYLAGASALVALSWPLSMFAQGIPEAEGGVRAEAGIDLRLELDNGDPEFRTGFDLDLITATRTQRLTFSGDFGLTVPLDDPEAGGFSDPSYGIDYLRDTGRSRLTFSADYSETDIDSLRRLDDDLITEFDESTLTTSDDGTRARSQAQIALELGLTDPVGAEIRYRFNDVAYTDVTDPDLEDSRLDELALALRFDVDPTLSFSLDGEARRTETEGLTPEDEERIRVGLGVDWQAHPSLSLNGDIAYVQIVTDTTILGVTERDERDGINLTLGAALDRPNGGYSFDLSRLLNTTGFVTTLEVGRRFDLPRGAVVSATIGATELPDGEIYPTGALTYGRETARGDLSLSLARTAAINDDDEAVERTILSGQYRLDLPRDAGLSLSGRLTDSDYVMGVTPDISSSRLSVTYNHPLTEDWGLGAGLTWEVTREEGAADDIDSRVFLSLERRFTLRR